MIDLLLVRDALSLSVTQSCSWGNQLVYRKMPLNFFSGGVGTIYMLNV